MKKIITILIFSFYLKITAQVCFSPATNFSLGTGSTPVSVVSADFNGDTKLDLAIANYTLNCVSILLGTGTGSFSTPTNFTVGTRPCSVTSADFNGDGKADLAATNQTSNNISILLGTGTGSFSAATNFIAGTTPVSIISADFNGDAKADLAIAGGGSNTVSVLLGMGTGSFGSATSFTAGSDPTSVTSADFNGDGKVDLAIANTNSYNISVLLGTGTGSFGSATNFLAAHSPGSIINADFNGDGHADIATADVYSGGNDLSVLLGTGTGSFNTAANFTVVGTNTYPISVISEDFNGDGKKDLAVANNTSSNVSVLLGTGTGSFGSATNFSISSSSDLRSVICADFNGDGKADLATADYSSRVSVLLNCNTTGTQQINHDEQITVYPNPTNGKFIIKTTIQEQQIIQVYDVNCNVVISQIIFGSTTFDASNLNEGIYSISFISSDGIVNKKLVIVK